MNLAATVLRVFVVVLLTAGLASAARADETILRRTPGSWFYGPSVVFTPASTTIAKFYPLSEPVLISGITRARFAYVMTRDFGDCKLRAAVRFSQDGTVFGADAPDLAHDPARVQRDDGASTRGWLPVCTA